MKATERLREWLDRSGTKQADLASQVGITRLRLCRLLRGKGTLPEAQLTRFEEVTGLRGVAAELAAEGPRERKVKSPPPPAAPPEPEASNPLVALRALIGEVPEGADPVALFGDCFGLPVLGGLLKLATSAKNEGTRLRALESLADRCFGKPVMRTRDETPRPPAESPELVELFATILKPEGGTP